MPTFRMTRAFANRLNQRDARRPPPTRREFARLAMASLCVFMAGVAPCRAAGDIRVVLLRGWFGVFSTGLDEIAAALREKGIAAEVRMHTSWDDEAAAILRDRAAGKTGPIVLVGHSQGANNAITLAKRLQSSNVAVDLLVTLAPFLQPPVPQNVLRAVNYYQSPGWGTALTGETGFRGKIENVNLIDDVAVLHITVDKTAKIQSRIVADIEALARSAAAPPPPAAKRTTSRRP